jgi:polysaccharide biosynthesis transport protein
LEEKNELKNPSSREALLQISPRDLLAIVFRHLGSVILLFLGISLAVLLYAFLSPKQYQSETKILVKRERVDPLVTAEAQVSPLPNAGVTEADVNSEIELLKSQDLLAKVVVAAGLDQEKKEDSWLAYLASLKDRVVSLIWPPEPIKDLAYAKQLKINMLAQDLATNLDVEPLSKSNLISVTYSSTDPEMAARVLNKLAVLYLDKHLSVQRPPGTLEFFEQETQRYRKGLVDIEARLSEFSQSLGAISPQIEEESVMRKISDFEGRARETLSGIAEAQERIRSIQAQLSSMPERLTTSVHTGNSPMIGQLKSTLSTLELKRIELLGKYEPGYRLVQELENQINQTKAALTDEEKNLQKDETSDWNPVHRMLTEDLAKAKADLASLQARYSATVQAVRNYREDAKELEQKNLAYHDLARAQKMAEDNYQLYVKKQEEARISNTLDQRRIVNVSIVETAIVPFRPSGRSRSVIVLAGGFLAGLSSLGVAFVKDFFDPTFRTPDEIRAFLKIPVLASIPRE